ncbi:MAG: hypothetical protein M3072_00475 [Candidatus Dormibacteraeota bacterium]|nr:hypothetical protein [Candidatus Dormibacteraeota bacterium]
MAESTARQVLDGRHDLRPARLELAHLRRRGGLISTEDLVLLARIEGLTEGEIRSLVASWEARRWPPR